MTSRETTHIPHLEIVQHFTPLVNRYEVRRSDAQGQTGEVLAFAQQKRLAIREQIMFSSDESRSDTVFSLRTGQVMDLGATYTISDDAGVELGTLRKDFARSLLRSTFHLEAGPVKGVGKERHMAVALLRRFAELPLPIHFDFTDTTTGETILSSSRTMSLRDRYHVEVLDERIDYRVAAAIAVGLDALMDR